ncbi:unnamed protein product [Caenorhabditis auriculariae]|uniref:Uncharacterized protein n=1 Tax=Caenorhabditis auriculariae TaxID=2777116 RepID=A0A8S1HX94_9PELO|nr:unnamed protein product [Caenorhabditis auriculariae]
MVWPIWISFFATLFLLVAQCSKKKSGMKRAEKRVIMGVPSASTTGITRKKQSDSECELSEDASSNNKSTAFGKMKQIFGLGTKEKESNEKLYSADEIFKNMKINVPDDTPKSVYTQEDDVNPLAKIKKPQNKGGAGGPVLKTAEEIRPPDLASRYRSQHTQPSHKGKSKEADKTAEVEKKSEVEKFSTTDTGSNTPVRCRTPDRSTVRGKSLGKRGNFQRLNATSTYIEAAETA